jgi:hypothetical protein
MRCDTVKYGDVYWLLGYLAVSFFRVETFANIYQTTWCHIPEESIILLKLRFIAQNVVPTRNMKLGSRWNLKLWEKKNKDCIFRGITSCSLSKINRCFEGKWHFHFQGQIINHGKKTAACYLFHAFLVWLVLMPWRWRRDVSPKHRLIFSGSQSVTSYNRAS